MGLLDVPPHWLLSITRSFQNSGPTLEAGSYEYTTGADPCTVSGVIIVISISIARLARTAARLSPVRGGDMGFVVSEVVIVESVGSVRFGLAWLRFDRFERGRETFRRSRRQGMRNGT
jgi:hypothetical protein